MLALAAGALLIGATPLAAACQMQRVAELPLHMDEGAVSVDIEIAGRSARMILDPSSPATYLYRSGAASLGLRVRAPTDDRLYALEGRPEPGEAPVRDVRLGMLAMRVSVMPVFGGPAAGPVIGILGADILGKADLEIDAAGGAVRLFRPKGCAGDQVVYWGKAYAETGLISNEDGPALDVDVQVNGQPVRARLDPASPVSTLSPDLAGRVGVSSASSGVVRTWVRTRSGEAPVPTYVARLTSFGFGDETVRHPNLAVADGPTGGAGLVLGADFLRSHRLYLARAQRRVYVSYVGGPVFLSPPVAPAP